MKHFSIKSPSNTDIAENLATQCKNCYKECNSIGRLIDECPKYGGNRRLGKIKNRKGTAFLCCDKTKTTKLFRQKLEALSYAYYDLVIAREKIIADTKKSEQQKINRLLHNLTSINAHNIQEIYDLAPQEILSSNWKTQLSFISDELIRDPQKAASMFLRIAKHNIHMKSEFSIYNKLDREQSINLDFRKHLIRKVFLNVLHTFFADFNDKKVHVNVSEYNGKIFMDYETVQVAFYHLIENASKYTKTNSQIYVDFTELNTHVVLSIEMKSYHVDPEERINLFLEGFSGRIAKSLGQEGEGIGMWRIRQMIELNGGEFTMNCGEIEDSSDSLLGIDYSTNKFSLTFCKNKPKT